MTYKLRAGTALAVAASILAAGQAQALTINLIDQGGVTGTAAEQGFKIAAAYWESVITNNVTLNFGVGYSALGTGIIGQTSTTTNDYSVANWETGVANTKSSSTLDQTAILPTLSGGNANNSGAAAFIVNGPKSGQNGVNTNTFIYDNETSGATATDNKQLLLSTANIKAVGGTATYKANNTNQLDATIKFSSTFGFDFDPTDGTSANTFDFIGTAIHEMGHALGFSSGVDYYDTVAAQGAVIAALLGDLDKSSEFTALDMFRYSSDPNNAAPGTGPSLDMSVGTASYFSIDGGQSQLFGDSLFSTGTNKGDGQQASHWKDNNDPATACTVQLGIMDPTECYAQEDYVTGLDLAAFDAIGWNLNLDVLLHPDYKMTTKAFYQQYMGISDDPGGVPEPASWAMMLAGFGLIGGALRRRSVRVAFAA